MLLQFGTQHERHGQLPLALLSTVVSMRYMYDESIEVIKEITGIKAITAQIIYEWAEDNAAADNVVDVPACATGLLNRGRLKGAVWR